MSLLERFRERALATPSAPLFRYLEDQGREADSMTVGESWQQCASLAWHLRRSCNLSPGDSALLVYPPSLDFVRALLGCLLAGVVPVPLPPPDPLRLDADLERFAALAHSSGARAVLTNTQYAAARTLGTVRHVFSRPWRRWPDLPWHTTDRARARPAEPLALARAASDTAFLQYTSGSTSQPKGVVLTYGNLEHQHTVSARELGLRPDAVMVSWLPHFHDFGLLSGILSALHGNGQYISMSPLAFVQRPQRWFEALSRWRGTHTAAPNFGYDLALRKTTERERAAWDLSALEVAMCAAEPIHPEMGRRFAEAFAVAKLRPDAFCPAYGLAEHSVGVSTRGRGLLRVDRDALEREGRVVPAGAQGEARSLVACGEPSEGVRVRVVDPETGSALSEGRVGELWVDSPSKAAGYFGLEEETARTFRARLPGDDREYLRTGDLGLLHDGQLFVTGRLKDVLIVRGRNLYPQDLEETARHAHPLVRPGGLAAFSELEQGEEKLLLVVEVREESLAPAKLREVARACAEAVLREHQQALRAVVLAPAGTVRKTTSGKVMRSACKLAWQRGELQRAALHVERAPEGAATAAQGDPRRRDLDTDFEALLEEVSQGFVRMTEARRGRVFHKEATTLRGTLRVLDAPALPPHRFFAPGARYSVLVRHANGVQEDDAAGDNRGATVRVLPLGSEDLEAPLLDLLLTTGACFLARSARDFHRWTRATAAEREALARAEPERSEAAWGMFRRPESYARLHYHSKLASRFTDARGGRWLARFRLVPADGAEDTGFLPSRGETLPPELMPRDPQDTRSRTFLHEELRARLAAGPVCYRLQLQLRPAGGEDEQRALDCTRPWAEAWRDVAALELDARADEGRVERLAFNPFHAPPELALPLARSAEDTASLGHLRSLVYELTARARLAPRATPPSKAEEPRRRLRVCVVGAGAAGLAAAWALEREGHAVTVLERGPEVAGKCASLQLDGHSFDWGGHLCTTHYTALAKMTDALGVAKDPATPTLLYDLETRSVRPREDNPRLRDEYLRYQGLRQARFAELLAPGLHRVAKGLAQPAEEWLRSNDLQRLGEALGTQYTACGYGFLQDRSLAALYVLKAAELGGILSTNRASGLPEAWTPRGGFGAFWRRVADSLADVRCDTAPESIERRGAEVLVRTPRETLTFDRLIVASPLDESLRFLDASAEERELFSRVRYLDYHTLVVRAQGLPRGGFYLLREHCRDAKHRGHAVAFHHRYEDSDVYLFYSYGAPGLDASGLEARLREDVARMGGRVDAVLAHRPWRYFPHVTGEELAGGYYDRLEALQGQRNTFFVGSLFNFELVEANVAYAHDLVARFFSAERPPSEAPAPSLAPLPASLSRASTPEARAALVTEYLQRILTEELQLPEPPLPSARFLDLGLDSVRSVELFQRLATDTGARTLAPVLFFDHPTVEALARYLSEELLHAPSTDARTRAASARPSLLAGRGRVHRTATYEQLEDLVIAERHGLALTVDVFVPTGQSNGLAVVDVASALWSSGRAVLVNHKVYGTYDAFCSQGFTVFAVRPGSAERCTGAEMTAHVHEALRYVRLHAHEYQLDGDRIGLLGGSSGGHLACLAALTAGPESRAQALVAHCPLTRYAPDDFAPENAALVRQLLALGGHTEGLSAQELRARSEALSPLHQVSPSAPPTLVLHGRRDAVVPFSASEQFVSALQAAGVRAELLARDSEGHPWPGIEKDMLLSARWMQETLEAPRDPGPAGAWLRAVRAVSEPSARLLCLHHAGGTSALFDAWPVGLPADVEVLSVELPGRGARASEPGCTELRVVVASLARALEPLLERPLVLFGHSLGAVLAFELCRELRRRGAPLPTRALLSGFVGPRAYRPEEALSAQDVGPAFALAGAATQTDFALFRSWRFEPEAPLAVPFTVLGGDADPFAPRVGLEAWRAECASSFEVETLPGGHLYFLQDAAPLLARLARALEPEGPTLDAFAASWRSRPYALAGAWNTFDLCWLARVAAEDGLEPAFPEALEALLALQRSDGGVGPRAPHSYCELVTALAFANTLLRWNTDGRHAAAIERALSSAMEAHERDASTSRDRDARFRFHGFFGRWLVPARECQALLERGGALLTASVRRVATTYASAPGVAFDSSGRDAADYERLFDEDSLALHFGEYFPSLAFTSTAAREHAARASGLPGLTAASAARYYEVTRDPDARARLTRALARPLDGLRPGGRLQELHFALAYLLRGGLDVRERFAPELAELEASVGPHGVGVEPGARAVDCDATAVTLRVCHALGLEARLPTQRLEGFWDPERRSYASADGNATYTLSTTLHVLEAWLGAPDASREEQLRVWRRTVALLEERPWVELHHLSPFYVWEKLVSIVGLHAHRFEEAPTRAHQEALGCILARQLDAGGFASAASPSPCREETALALLALRSALRWPEGLERRDEVEAAARRARQWLRAPRRTPEPALWVGKLLYLPVNLVDAIELAALAP